MTNNESQEMYLETILKLQKRKGTVHAIDVAEELGYSRNTIKYNIDKLAEAGLISKAGGKLTVVQDIFVEMPTG